MAISDGNPASRERGFCPCCGYAVLNAARPGSAEVCPICFWIDDIDQFVDPEYVGEENEVSLREARENVREHGACAPQVVELTRDPDGEARDPNWPYE